MPEELRHRRGVDVKEENKDNLAIGYNEKIKFAFNEDFESGIASSIKKGLMSLNEKTKFTFKNLYSL